MRHIQLRLRLVWLCKETYVQNQTHTHLYINLGKHFSYTYDDLMSDVIGTDRSKRVEAVNVWRTRIGRQRCDHMDKAVCNRVYQYVYMRM